MAEVITTDISSDESARKKRGKFLSSEDLIIVREVSALRAHVAAYGTVRQTFESVAQKVYENPHMTQKVTWKSVQDRYKRLQEDFDSDDARNSGLSGIAGGEIGELYQCLSQMQERDSFVDKKKAAKNEKAKKEEEKEILGKKVVEMALLRKSQRTSDEESNEGDDGSGDGQRSESARKRTCKRAKVGKVDLTSGLALFAEKLKDADLAEGILQFEKHKHEVELVEREKDRAERRKEREDANKLEFDKFKLMMDVFKVQRK